MNYYLKVLGIDPGSFTTGLALLTVDIRDWSVVDVETALIDVNDAVIDDYKQDKLYHRLMVMKNRVYDLATNYEPDLVSIESGYIDRFRPAAYGVLSKTMFAIVEGIKEYDLLTPIEEFRPKVAKKLIGVSNQNKKETTLEALLELKELTSKVDLNKISEHEVDAISLAYPAIHKYKELGNVPW